MVLETQQLSMTDSARDSLIAMSVLWLLFVVVVGFRLRGRFRGPGLALDDILAMVALVCFKNPLHERKRLTMMGRFSQLVQLV